MKDDGEKNPLIIKSDVRQLIVNDNEKEAKKKETLKSNNKKNK